MILSTDLQHHLYTMTGGHIGFLSRILSACLSDIYITDESSLATFILSNNFVANLCQLRGVPAFGRLSADQKEICRRIVLSGSYTPSADEVMEVKDNDKVDGLAYLVREGWVCKVHNTVVTFASPLTLYVTSVQLFSSYRVDDVTSNFMEFLFLTLQKLDPTNLRKSLVSCTDDILLERSWQMEFYRAASACLGRKSHISPDRTHFRIFWVMYFYVNGDKQWEIAHTRGVRGS